MKKLLFTFISLIALSANAQCENDSTESESNLRIAVDGVVNTSINTVTKESNEPKEYSLNGKELPKNNTEGIIIRKGKKYLKKN